MRLVAALLFVALVAAGVWSFAVAPDRGWWMPRAVSSFGGDVDRLFGGILAVIAVSFVLVIGLLAWLVWRGSARRAGRATFTHGNTRLEIAWTAVPFAILVAIAIVQLSVWNTIQAERSEDGLQSRAPLAEVIAEQFDWRFRYAGADARFDTADDVEVPYRLVVPVGERVVLALRSRDVIHGFFVPAFRVKQDVLPGTVLTAWFEAREVGEYDLLCSQLCGAGHYQMAGKIRVVPRAEYEAWLQDAQRALMSNGQEDRR
jgi:cytochrome c oxidase subunit II